MRSIDVRALARVIGVALPSLAVGTLAIAIFQEDFHVPNASVIYLAAVVATAFVAGTWGAVVAAVASFLLYDFLFVRPLYTFTVADPGEWLNLVILLFTGVVVGQLVAIQRSRTEVALAREREARTLFRVSRELATRESTPAVLPTIAQTLRQEAGMDRVWVSLGPDEARERVAADTNPDVRNKVINSLFISNDAKALVTLAKKETDPEMKKKIVSMLANMHSPDATAYLLELLNK